MIKIKSNDMFLEFCLIKSNQVSNEFDFDYQNQNLKFFFDIILLKNQKKDTMK